MASTTLTTAIRRRLSTFAAGVARPFTDSRRRRFVTDMLTGLVAGGHVHLTAVARATHRGEGQHPRRREAAQPAPGQRALERRAHRPPSCSAGRPRWSPTTP